MRGRSVALTALLLLSACDDTLFEGEEGAVSGEGYDAVVEIFDTNCVSCHSDAGAPSFGNLSLEGDICEKIVGVEATAYDGMLVEAGDHEGSVLWHKMAGTGTHGGIMPPGASPDAEAQVANAATVAAWIDEDAATDCETGR